jgi:hypothetical protein
VATGISTKRDSTLSFCIAARKNRTVKEALENNTWLSDLRLGLTDDMLPELISLAHCLDVVNLNVEITESIRWWPEATGEYTTKSAYLLQYSEAVDSDFKSSIWKCWAPGKCKFFVWTAALDRILTADALQRCGWENNYFCVLCFSC